MADNVKTIPDMHRKLEKDVDTVFAILQPGINKKSGRIAGFRKKG